MIYKLALFTTAFFTISTSVVIADNYRSIHFNNNTRPVGFADNNFRPLGFDPPPLRYPSARYSLDNLRNHPYNSALRLGQTYARPFRPGLGYQSPYGRLLSPEYRSLNPYTREYVSGVRQSRFQGSDYQYYLRNESYNQFRANAYGGPWYFPGSNTNVRTRTFSW